MTNISQCLGPEIRKTVLHTVHLIRYPDIAAHSVLHRDNRGAGQLVNLQLHAINKASFLINTGPKPNPKPKPKPKPKPEPS